MMFLGRVKAVAAVAAAAALALGATLLAPTAASAAEGDVTIIGDTYTKVLFHRDIGWATLEWKAECPDHFQWLDGRKGTDGRDVGRGIVVSESALIVRWYGEAQLKLVPNPATGILDRHGVSGIHGSVGNAFPWMIGVEIKMVCTNNPKYAWIWS